MLLFLFFFAMFRGKAMRSALEFNYQFAHSGESADRAPGAIGGKAAWRGVEMMKRRREWVYNFTNAELSELDNAMRGSFQMEIADIRRTSFVLPTLGPIFNSIRKEILKGRGFVLLRGIPTLDYTVEEAARVFYGLGTYFGNARSQNSKGHLLGHVCNLGGEHDAFKNPGKTRIYQTRVRQAFHTDSIDVVALLCLQKSKSGGESSICSSVSIHDEMYRRDEDLWEVMYKPFWRDRRGEVPPGKFDYYPMAAFHYFEGNLSTIFSRDYIESCSRFPDVPQLSDKQIAALDLFDELSKSTDLRLDMSFEPGDIQFLHNHQILHARADFEDWPEIKRRRHLLRLWLSPENGRPLPTSMLERYLTLEIGKRGGIVGPNTKLSIPLEPI